MRLPSEKELAASFQVSRPIVREALSRLRSDGILVSRHGSGSYIQHQPNRALFDVAPTGSIAGLMRTFEFRLALECEAAALAAMRRAIQDVSHITRARSEEHTSELQSLMTISYAVFCLNQINRL